MKLAFLLSKGLLCLYDKQNNTQFLVDMKFFFSCSTQHLPRCAHSWAIKLNTQREIPYLHTPMYYSPYITLASNGISLLWLITQQAQKCKNPVLGVKFGIKRLLFSFLGARCINCNTNMYSPTNSVLLENKYLSPVTSLYWLRSSLRKNVIFFGTCLPVASNAIQVTLAGSYSME